MKKILTVGVTYTGESIEGVEIENLGLCRPEADHDKAAFPLYEYDAIIINPASFSHFIFGTETEFSKELYELGALKRKNEKYDLDAAFDGEDRRKEMKAALEKGANVIWCLSEPKRHNFFGYRETHLGYLTSSVAKLIKSSDLTMKKGRQLAKLDQESPFVDYFKELSKSGWTFCLADIEEGYSSIAETPEGYSLGGRYDNGSISGWILTPPTSETAENILIRTAVSLEKSDLKTEKYHGIFLSHTSVDKPFVRQLRDDLLAHGVENVWFDEAEIEIGDSLTKKIEEGMACSRYIGIVLSQKSIDAPWVQKELEIAINREINQDEVVLLPLLYEECELPVFLSGKLYADFTDPEQYNDMLSKLLRRLRVR